MARTSFRWNSPSLPVVIPAIYGLKGVGFETYTGDGPISYWNIGIRLRARLSIRGLVYFIVRDHLVTPKLLALLAYQLNLETPPPPVGGFDPAAARGERLPRQGLRPPATRDQPHRRT